MSELLSSSLRNWEKSTGQLWNPKAWHSTVMLAWYVFRSIFGPKPMALKPNESLDLKFNDQKINFSRILKNVNNQLMGLLRKLPDFWPKYWEVKRQPERPNPPIICSRNWTSKLFWSKTCDRCDVIRNLRSDGFYWNKRMQIKRKIATLKINLWQLMNIVKKSYLSLVLRLGGTSGRGVFDSRRWRTCG
jgi:hypothetical protein